MNKASVICCYNDEEKFKVFKESLQKQSLKVELVALDNRYNYFPSCAKALNFGLKKVHSKIVIFSHQDIIFKNENSIEKFVHDIESIDEFDLIGVAGASASKTNKNGHVVFSNILNKNMENIGEPIKKITECETLDECFFGGYTKCFIEYPFDEDICNGWHLYSVDRCLSALTRNSKVYVSNLELIHTSMGRIDYKFNKCFFKLSVKYARKINYIHAPCAFGKTNFLARTYLLLKHDIGVFFNRY